MKEAENPDGKIKGGDRSNPFRVPDNYFKELEVRIQERISSADKEDQSPVPLLRTRLAFVIASIAILLVGYLSVTTLMNPTKNIRYSEEFAEILEYYADDFEEIEIWSILEDDPILPDFGEFSDDEIVKYLIEEDIEIKEIQKKL